MKKKMYFILSSIVQILLSVHTIITAKKILSAQIDSFKDVYKSFPEELQKEMIESLQNTGDTVIIIFSVIIIIFSIITMITAIKNKILNRKGMIVAFSAITIFLAQSFWVILLAIINLIVLICIDRKNVKNFSETSIKEKNKKEMPKMERLKPSIKDIVLGIVLVLLYFSSLIWGDFLPDSRNIRVAASIINDIVILVLAIIIFYKELKIAVKAFFNNFSVYIKFVLSRIGIMFVAVIILNLIVMTICNIGSSANQEAIEALPKWYSIPMAVIWAPIVEEILFRGVLRRVIRNNTAFIIVSAIVFGFLHTIVEATIFNMIVMAIPYATIGGFLAYMYTKTNNICSNISGHAIYNFIGALLTLV